MAEPNTTGKILIHTTKGKLEIELWCKECSVTCYELLTRILAKELQGIKLHKVNDLVHLPLSINKSAKDKNSRVRFKRGYVGVDNGLIMGLDDGWQGLVIGKIIGQGVFVLESINDEFDCLVNDVEIVVPYFDGLKLDNVQETQVVPEKVKDKKRVKKKIKLDYDDEEDIDDNFEMKSSYELMPKKVKQKVDKEGEAKEEKVDIEGKVNKEVISTDKQPEQRTSSESDENKDVINQELENTKENEEQRDNVKVADVKNEIIQQEKVEEKVEEKEQKEKEQKEKEQKEKESDKFKQLNYEFDKYKDIPFKLIKDHKYRE